MRITDADGAVGIGYSYTIGTGGHSVVELLARTLAPALIGREAGMVETDLARSAVPHPRDVGRRDHGHGLAAIDTALWDLRCRKAGLPLHIMAGGAQDKVRLYTTEGGWLHLEAERARRGRIAAKEAGFGGARSRSAGRSRGRRSDSRRCAPRSGPAFEIFTDANQAFAVDEAIRRARHYEAARHRLVRGAAAGRRPRRSCAAVALDDAADGRRREPLQPLALPRISAARRLFGRAGRRRPDRRHHALAEDRASGRDVQRRGLPAFPDGAACGALLRQCRTRAGSSTSRSSTGITGAPMNIDDGHAVPSADPGLGIEWDWPAIDRLTVEGSRFVIGKGA